MENYKNYRPYTYKRICRNPEHEKEFETNSPTRKYCCEYCKHRYHYLKFKHDHANKIFFEEKERENYKIFKGLYDRGENLLTVETLEKCGADLYFAPYV